jgi:hypothetical protein
MQKEVFMANDENIAEKAWREIVERRPRENSATMALREFNNRMANSPSDNVAAIAWREFNTRANLTGYRADREPDASWYRPSNHRPPSQPMHPNTYEQAADEKRKRESQPLVQPLIDIFEKIRMNNRRLIEKDEFDRMCRKYGLNYNSLSKEDKAKYLDKCFND